ncbi:MAG: restriction endonuclease [Planctomycetota bacterium]
MSKEAQKTEETPKIYGEVKGPYEQTSIKRRIEALFLDNLGKVFTREQIQQVAKDPETGKEPENWHQRLSELRTDDGYTILSWRNRGDLDVEQYLMPNAAKRPKAAKRVRPTDSTWLSVLKRADYRCEWPEGGKTCGLKAGDIDPVGGGTVKLTPDHKTPHSKDAHADASDPEEWQALCGRHQVVKKNYWDDNTGWLNVGAIVQAAGRQEKWQVFIFLLEHFGYTMKEDGVIERRKAKPSRTP